MKPKIRKDDMVVVLAGKDKGRKGKVHSVDPVKGRVVVSGVNIVKRHTKPRGMARQAGIVEQEAPVDLSNVAMLCGKCGSATRVGQKILADGTKARFCRSCGELLSQ